MSVAQVIRFDERQAIPRPQREPQHRVACVILEFRAPRKRRATAAPSAVAAVMMPDEDRSAGRGRDPG